MDPSGTYLQKAWGDSLEGVTRRDIQKAILETIKMDEEHGAFWVGIFDQEEIILEAHKDLTVVGVFSHGQEITARLSSWNQIEDLYDLFLVRDFEKVKEILLLHQ